MQLVSQRRRICATAVRSFGPGGASLWAARLCETKGMDSSDELGPGEVVSRMCILMPPARLVGYQSPHYSSRIWVPRRDGTNDGDDWRCLNLCSAAMQARGAGSHHEDMQSLSEIKHLASCSKLTHSNGSCLDQKAMSLFSEIHRPRCLEKFP